MIDPLLKAAAARWLARDPWEKTGAQLSAWLAAEDEPALRGAFGPRVRFGTAGLRAPVGPGPAYFNALVVRESAAGIARVLMREGYTGATVAVGYDGRLDSADLARQAAGVLLAAGFAVALFGRPTPTPVVGFYVQQQTLCAGLVITASHNPAADNGLKLYWHTGAQIAPPVDATIARAIDDVAGENTPVPFVDPITHAGVGPREAERRVHDPAAAAIAGYLSALAAQPSLRLARTRPARSLALAYTPLHGVGTDLVLQALRGAPVTDVYVVATQREPDGRFPTLASPNPEHASAMAEVLALAERTGAALALANDPDADRLAVAARVPGGALSVLHGDDVGVLLADWLLALAAQGGETRALWTATSAVSSRLLARVAAGRGAHAQVTLPGFKWLAAAAQAAERRGERFVLAYEEALGYAPGSLVWDKDGVSALVYVVQRAAQLHAHGQTLWDELARLHAQHGLALNQQVTVAAQGDGAARWMAALRGQLPEVGGPFHVERTLDGRDEAQCDGLPPSDRITWHCTRGPSPRPGADDVAVHTSDGSFGVAQSNDETKLRIIVRPSGTEPKLKVYYELLAPAPPLADYWPARASAQAHLAQAIEGHREWLLARAEG